MMDSGQKAILEVLLVPYALLGTAWFVWELIGWMVGKKKPIPAPSVYSYRIVYLKEDGSIDDGGGKPVSITLASCTRPPRGWFCTRKPGHEGPCPAWPIIEIYHTAKNNDLTAKETPRSPNNTGQRAGGRSAGRKRD